MDVFIAAGDVCVLVGENGDVAPDDDEVVCAKEGGAWLLEELVVVDELAAVGRVPVFPLGAAKGERETFFFGPLPPL